MVTPFSTHQVFSKGNLKKYIWPFLPSLLVFTLGSLFGIYHGYYRTEVFSFVNTLKDVVYPSSFQGRYNNTSARTLSPELTNPLVIITYGQSHTTNSVEIFERDVNPGVHNYYDGEVYLYEDPSLGANGVSSSTWGLLGDRLLEETGYMDVVFANCGYGGRSIRLLAGKEFHYLDEVYHKLILKYGHVDYLLFWQGGANNSVNRGHENYEEEFDKLYGRIDSIGFSGKFLMMPSSYVRDTIDYGLRRKQRAIVQRHPEIDTAKSSDGISERHYDRTHLNAKGARLASEYWLELILRNRK